MYYLEHQLSISITFLHRCTCLLVGFCFPIGQVPSQVWCRSYLAAFFGSFETDTFPWSQNRVQVYAFYYFTFKVGFNFNWDIPIICAICPVKTSCKRWLHSSKQTCLMKKRNTMRTFNASQHRLLEPCYMLVIC